MKKVLTGIFIAVISIILVFNILSIFQLSFFGFRIFRISSGSMEPYLKVNDVIIVKREKDYKVKDVVTYKDENMYVTHRIIKIKDGKYTLKGDANNTYDDKLITKNKILGKVVYKFKLIVFNRSNKNFFLLFGVFIIGLIVTTLIPSKNKT